MAFPSFLNALVDEPLELPPLCEDDSPPEPELSSEPPLDCPFDDSSLSIVPITDALAGRAYSLKSSIKLVLALL